LGCISIPKYILAWQEAASFSLTICIIVMLCLEPIFWCWTHQNGDDGRLFEEKCPEAADKRLPYTAFSCAVMFFYYALLLDLSVSSTRICAFVLVCVRMLSEVGLFLLAFAMSLLTFACAMSVLDHDAKDFAGIPNGLYALFRMALGAYSPKKYAMFREEPLLLVMMIVFLIFTVIFLLNLLIAQLSCAYSAVYSNMVGYARLKRAETIIDLMPGVPKHRWEAFIQSLGLQRRLEFNQGDVGVNGGIQLKEVASLNPTTVDMIRRFGGSTSPEIQWPEDEADGDGDDRFERMEKLLAKTLQRVTKGGSGRGRMSGTAGDSEGTGNGTKNSDSDKSGGSESEE